MPGTRFQDKIKPVHDVLLERTSWGSEMPRGMQRRPDPYGVMLSRVLLLGGDDAEFVTGSATSDDGFMGAAVVYTPRSVIVGNVKGDDYRSAEVEVRAFSRGQPP